MLLVLVGSDRDVCVAQLIRAFTSDLAHEEELLGKWLDTMDGQIQPITCRLPRGCSLHALQERFKDNQVRGAPVWGEGGLPLSPLGSLTDLSIGVLNHKEGQNSGADSFVSWKRFAVGEFF